MNNDGHKKNVKNMSASVHERLLQRSKKDQRRFDELLQYFAMERFLYRWSKSTYAKTFVAKGGAYAANMERIGEQIDHGY